MEHPALRDPDETPNQICINIHNQNTDVILSIASAENYVMFRHHIEQKQTGAKQKKTKLKLLLITMQEKRKQKKSYFSIIIRQGEQSKS